MNNITFDKNGMISDSDKIYEELDQCYNEKEYDKIAAAVMDIPREHWSNKLWFRLISAYNNLKQFGKASEELDAIYPRCDNPVDISHWHYMRGYILYVNRKHLMAIHCFEDGLEADPNDSLGFELDKEIEDARVNIEKDINTLRELSEKVTRDIKKRYAQMPYSDKYELSDEEFTMQLGFLPGIRKIPGQEHGLGFKEYFKKYEGEKREQAKEWFGNLFGVTDRGSFIEFFQTNRCCNISRFARDVLASLNGKSAFDISELNKNGRRLFDDVTLFVKVFAEFLPAAGVAAWDMSEKIGFCRHAYAVDFLTHTDYCTCMSAMMDDVKASFSSTEEYMLSMAFGSALYMFMEDERSIPSAIDFLLKSSAFIIHGDLGDIRWKE